jgi:hypothetical protein
MMGEITTELARAVPGSDEEAFLGNAVNAYHIIGVGPAQAGLLWSVLAKQMWTPETAETCKKNDFTNASRDDFDKGPPGPFIGNPLQTFQSKMRRLNN